MSNLGGGVARIDAWEAMRRAVLEHFPASAGEIARRQGADWRRVGPRDRAAIALAVALDRDPSQAIVRRQMRAMLQDFERDGLIVDPDADGLQVREAPMSAYSDMAASEKEKLAQDVTLVMSPAFTGDLDKAAGPAAALAIMNRRAQVLKGQKGARFLAELGYPMAVADRARRRFLHRFGLLDGVAETQGNRQEGLRLLEEFAHEAGVGLPELDVVLGLFTGAVPPLGESVYTEWCGTQPRCRECPVLQHCAYGRFLKSHGRLEEATQETRRNLADAMLPEDRPREKLVAQGAETLTNAELLAILLRTGSGKEHAVELANRLLREAGSLDRLGRASIAELTRIPGLGPVKAVTVKAALELARRISTRGMGEESGITGARDVFERLRSYFIDRQKEQFLCLLLNTKNRVTRQVVVSEGTLNQSLVHPREAFQEAVRDSAAAVIFVHNHPSGDPAPSRDDKLITQRLVRAGEVVGVRVLDHVIIGRDTYYSFADNGELTA